MLGPRVSSRLASARSAQPQREARRRHDDLLSHGRWFERHESPVTPIVEAKRRRIEVGVERKACFADSAVLRRREYFDLHALQLDALPDVHRDVPVAVQLEEAE